MRTKILLFGFLSLLATGSFSQSLNDLNPYLQKTRVGLVDEFFSRFNGSEVHPDFPKTKPNSRKINLMMLIDLAQFKSKESPEYLEASNMMDVAIDKNVHIDYSDSSWIALAHCVGKLDGKDVKFDMYLTVQHRRKSMYKWVISKVDGSIFDITPKNLNEGIMLYPDDHETNFMSLRRMTTEQPSNIINFIGKGFEYDNMSVFNYLIYNNKLKISHVEKLEFIFTQIPGYIFNVAYFNRQNYNTGWLISKFHKATEQEKDSILQSLHFNNKKQKTSNDISEVDTTRIKEMQTRGNETTSSLESLFYKRCDERVMQVYEFSSFVKQSLSKRAYSFYAKKLSKNFGSNAFVNMIEKPDKTLSRITVFDFCKYLAAHKQVVCESIDSVCLPLWNKSLNDISNAQDSVALPAYKYAFINGRVDRKSGKKIDMKLYAIKDDTENGLEWVPQIGYITVSIRKEQ